MATYSYTVTASGSDHYLWSGHGLENSPDPDLYFHAGDSLTITNNSGAHPMRISGSGVTIDESGGEIVIASVSAGSYTYVCTTHPTTMTGQITVSAIASNLNPRDGYGTGPLRELPIPLSSLKTKINEIIRKGGIGGASVGTEFPTNPSDGDLFYDETTGALYIFLGEIDAWIQTNGGGSGSGGDGASIAVSETAPASPSDGDLWFNTTEGQLYVYVASETAWFQTNGGGGSSGTGQTYFEIHSYYIKDTLVDGNGKISVSEFTEGINTTTSNDTRIDQAVGDGGTFKMFKSPSTGLSMLEIDAAIQDFDADSGDRFRLYLKSCTSESGVTKTSDGSVTMTTLSVGTQTSASSSLGPYGSSRVKYQGMIEPNTYFFLEIEQIDGGTVSRTNATVKMTTILEAESSLASSATLISHAPSERKSYLIHDFSTGSKYIQLHGFCSQDEANQLNDDYITFNGNAYYNETEEQILVGTLQTQSVSLSTSNNPGGLLGGTFRTTNNTAVNITNAGGLGNTLSYGNFNNGFCGWEVVGTKLYFITEANSSSSWNSEPWTFSHDVYVDDPANVGGITGTGGASIEVSDTAPSSPSDGDLWFNTTEAELYVYVDAEGAWVQTNGGGGTGSGNFTTGWVNTDGTTTVADGATLTFDHNLGTTDVIFDVYVADDSNGTNAFRVGDAQDAGFNTAYGASIQSITNSNFVLQLGSGGTHGGAMTMDSSGDKSFIDYANKYIKVVVSSGAGSGPRAYVAFDGTAADLTASITNSFNITSLVDKGVGWYEVNYTNPVNNPVPTTTVESPSETNPHDSSVYNVTANSLEILVGFTALNGSGRLDREGVFLVVH